MKKVLITGFDAFGGSQTNPSWLAVSKLPDRVGDWEVHKKMIPTVYGEASRQVLAAAEALQPHAILCVGLAGGRNAVTPERIAVNIRDARIADNAGNLCQGDFVVEGGPAAYFATVPVKEMSQAIRDGGIASSVSNTAGAFVCNDTLYTLLHRFDGTQVQVGFIHVPQIPEMGEPSMPLETIAEALKIAITALK